MRSANAPQIPQVIPLARYSVVLHFWLSLALFCMQYSEALSTATSSGGSDTDILRLKAGTVVNFLDWALPEAPLPQQPPSGALSRHVIPCHALSCHPQPPPLQCLLHVALQEVRRLCFSCHCVLRFATELVLLVVGFCCYCQGEMVKSTTRYVVFFCFSASPETRCWILAGRASCYWGASGGSAARSRQQQRRWLAGQGGSVQVQSSIGVGR